MCRHRQQVMRTDTTIATIVPRMLPGVAFEGLNYVWSTSIKSCDSRLKLIIGAAWMQLLRFESDPSRSYDVETFCSASTVFFTVGRFIMRSCHAV